MAKVKFVKAAAKDHPNYGIKKGESYYWWQNNRFSPKRMSKTQPRASETASSDFESVVYGLLESVEDGVNYFKDVDTVSDDIESITSDIESCRDEEQEKLDNMPEGFQQGPAGERIQERIDNAESAISELEAINTDKEDEETDEDFLTRVKDEAIAALGNSF
jgi:vacuolar-type H+-ATPase subunit I/STV1